MTCMAKATRSRSVNLVADLMPVEQEGVGGLIHSFEPRWRGLEASRPVHRSRGAMAS